MTSLRGDRRGPISPPKWVRSRNGGASSPVAASAPAHLSTGATMAPRALVTQAGSRVGYTIVRSLAALGVCVVCTDSARWTPTRLSRYCSAYVRSPDPHSDSDRYLEFINGLVAEYGIDQILPAYDEAYFLAKHRHRLARPEVLVTPPYAQYTQLHHKPSFYELASEVGCLVPGSIALHSERDLQHAAESFGFPMMLKPECGGGGWAVEQVQSFAELERRWREFDRAAHENELFAQERVEGVLCGHGVVASKGRVVNANSYTSLRQYPIGTGPATCRTRPPANDMAAQAEKVIAAADWTGPCHFDFIVDPATGRSWVIDCNPRFWGSIDHAEAAGFDVAQSCWRVARGEAVPQATDEGPDTVWFWGDLLNLLSHLRHDPKRGRLVLQRLGAWRRAVIDDWDWRDPLPFLGQPACRVLGGAQREGF